MGGEGPFEREVPRMRIQLLLIERLIEHSLYVLFPLSSSPLPPTYPHSSLPTLLDHPPTAYPPKKGLLFPPLSVTLHLFPSSSNLPPSHHLPLPYPSSPSPASLHPTNLSVTLVTSPVSHLPKSHPPLCVPSPFPLPSRPPSKESLVTCVEKNRTMRDQLINICAKGLAKN